MKFSAMLFVWLGCLTAVLLASGGFGGESVPTTAPAVETVAAQGEWVLHPWLSFILSFEFVWKALVTGGGLLIAWIFKLEIFQKIENANAKEALAALQAGVTKTYEEFVLEAKRAQGDGKLSVDERKTARDMAINHAKQIATGPIKAVLLKWGKERMEAYIAQIVAKMKAKKEKKEEQPQ